MSVIIEKNYKTAQIAPTPLACARYCGDLAHFAVFAGKVEGEGVLLILHVKYPLPLPAEGFT